MFPMEKIVKKNYSGERSLFGAKNLFLEDVAFLEGESPLKETSHIELLNCSFSWKYPLWYSNHLKVRRCRFYNESHAGIWYTKDSSFDGCSFEEGKNFRHSKGFQTAFSRKRPKLFGGVKTLRSATPLLRGIILA